MPPVVMYARQYSRDDIIDPGVCTLCGNVTSLLISFRLAEYLVDMCGECTGFLSRAYDRMAAERMQFKLAPRPPA